jgi:hypothetical protein
MMAKAHSRTICVALAVTALAAASARFSAPAGPTKQPNEIGELGLWLSASDLAKTHRDGQSITRWPDKSGKGYDAVFEGRIPQAALQVGVHRPPTFKIKALGRYPAVSFNAADRQTLILNRAGHALGQNISGFSAAFLVRPSLVYGPAPAPDVSWSKNRYLFISHVSNYDTRVSVQIIEGTGEVKLYSRPQPKQKLEQNSSFADGRQLALTGDAWHRLMVTVDYKAKETRIVIDGTVLVRALPPTTLDIFEDVPSPITGIGSNTLDAWLTCQVAELICYQKALGIDELQSLDAYLCKKYSLQK